MARQPVEWTVPGYHPVSRDWLLDALVFHQESCTMKAIRIDAFNDIPSQKEVPVPVIAPDEVLVRVQAAALNPLDALVVSGVATRFFDIALPLTLATDFAGTVERVGSAVRQWLPGDQVIAWADAGKCGGLAEFAAIPASACVRLPGNLSYVEGAAIPTAAVTAWYALFAGAGLKRGETVLIHAGAGGVGTFAVQFAHKAGARVIATASGEGLELARSLGADHVIDYRSQDFTAVVSEVDVVLDLVGGDTQLHSYKVLRKWGRLVSTVMPPDQAAAGVYKVTASMFYAKPYAEQLGELVSYIAENNVRVVIDLERPFEAFDEAWARQLSGRARGKIVIAEPEG
ncbi:NADP-dependent oxidoreductase [Pseudomonas capsici]|uniref:NADP-dependent oxidoreductase n=1 Tax=Pseudomonas capsici TaxID=2810614 RepID=A0ABT3C3K5_9PSED|nr:NADP-dependent oxidoreductase [Pseudomonas capsici]MBN6715475.1 NADP-dependent oxidoreductase [Pseudomonas capsici]MBN6720384.1 NADP-dependent oxidoreductase [Pseudomonas capsici]MBN6725406.1 NADP-dependent oxidoreductase [Pseudomonas capsici]MCV4270740.1 NADP-dependent oxidoreductase [Pseudomonas capsici]MCV4280934.1 NADP-dependent oxidoreductase [Pseudomonas capsici]